MRYLSQKPHPAYDKLTDGPPVARYVGMGVSMAASFTKGDKFLAAPPMSSRSPSRDLRKIAA
ncbi:hypothetical protein SAMN04488518_101216 [Pseudovibrio ascidiaceicola]|uniref:Uncharacterized protein n=1 Tax=Pseudovibrio ascidiaceicola TaxID=285279 RepID=A0A1I3V9F5_9HYPH|nr:hypothetical protein SAMN04488518_101216 [Pseudovibrio ascidiaceicola]